MESIVTGTVTQPEMTVLWEDDRFLAVDKPAGVFVHDTALHRGEISLTTLLRRSLGIPRLSPVHRLDRPTSGVLVFAKDEEAASLFGKKFAARAVDKRYLAVVRGLFPQERDVDHALADEDGQLRACLTRVERREAWEFPVATKRHLALRLSLIEVMPTTGRRHQIRRHCKHLFHPIVGDTVYGDGEVNRIARGALGVTALLLHARHLWFEHPVTGEEVRLTAPAPAWLDLLRTSGRTIAP